jgi:DNA-binding XRE family transcriptional regulator
MARPYKELRDKVRSRPGAEQRVGRRAAELEHAVTLGELRKARELTQVQLAEALEVSQPEISRIEKQTDLYLSTLRSYVEAMGGTLVLHAVFPDGSDATISSLRELETA